MAMEYRNLMEDIVLQNLDTVMAAEGGCTCDACKSDVVSYALNHLTPHYVATRQGRLMVKLQSYEMQSRADVVAAVSEAAVMVAKGAAWGFAVGIVCYIFIASREKRQEDIAYNRSVIEAEEEEERKAQALRQGAGA